MAAQETGLIRDSLRASHFRRLFRHGIEVEPVEHRPYFGDALHISGGRDLKHFTADAINIEDKDEPVNMRIYLKGRVSAHVTDDDYVVIESKAREIASSPLIALLSSFTTSAAFSDNITDYREPNTAIGTRISNRFFKRLADSLRVKYPRTKCDVGAI